MSHHGYFYNKIQTNDGRYFIYASNADGERNLYKMDLTDGRALQLTENDNINDFGYRLTSDDKYLILFKGDRLVKMNMDTLEDTILYEQPEGWITYKNPGISTDDRYIAGVEMNKKDRVERGKGDWSGFRPQFERKPECRIFYLDTKTGKSHIVHEEKNCWLAHPQIRPFDNNTILFCHEGPGLLIDARLWLVNSDGTKHRCAKPKSINNEHVTHEYWLKDGSGFAFVQSESDMCDMMSVRMIDPDTLQEVMLIECNRSCHITSNYDNTIIVGDGKNNTSDYLYKIDLREQKTEKLCYHGTSWQSYGTTQDSHPHPMFSSDEKHIFYTSDIKGLPCVFMVEL